MNWHPVIQDCGERRMSYKAAVQSEVSTSISMFSTKTGRTWMTTTLSQIPRKDAQEYSPSGSCLNQLVFCGDQQIMEPVCLDGLVSMKYKCSRQCVKRGAFRSYNSLWCNDEANAATLQTQRLATRKLMLAAQTRIGRGRVWWSFV